MSAIRSLRCADDRPFFTDKSNTNGPLNAEKARALKPWLQGFAFRGSISWGYTDPVLAHDVEIASGYDFWWFVYHVLYPKQSAARQMDRMLKTASNPGPSGRRILDIELAGDGRGDPDPAPPGRWAELAWDVSEMCLREDGKRPIIYSRTSLVNAWLVPFWTTSQLNAHYWWLAVYLARWLAVARWAAGANGEYLGEILLPKGLQRERVLMVQTSDTCPAFTLYPPGPVEPRGSYRQDTDRWMLGERESIVEFAGAA